jgi:hypothetical protein
VLLPPGCVGGAGGGYELVVGQWKFGRALGTPFLGAWSGSRVRCSERGGNMARVITTYVTVGSLVGRVKVNAIGPMVGMSLNSWNKLF